MENLEILQLSELKIMNLFLIKKKLNFTDKFKNMNRRIKKNSLIAYYYDLFSYDLQTGSLPKVVENSKYFKEDFWNRRKDDLNKRGERVFFCGHYWTGDYYIVQGVKDLKKTNLCMDRFCDNCQNTLSVQRSDKYLPVLERLMPDYDVYHVVLTVPNVPLSELSVTLDRMFYAYKRLCIFLSGRLSVRNVDYSKFGYLGSIRALEITKNHEKNTFHPHFHCIFVCKKGSKLCSGRDIVNLYSFKKYNSHIKGTNYASNDPQREFTKLEVLLQKTWRLLYDGVELNYSNLDELSLGYSCMIDSAKGRCKEVFKYATKGLLSSDPNKDPVDHYEDFVLLFCALYRRRLIQGYGCLYRLKFEDNIDLSADDLYLEVLKSLHELENPIAFHEDLKSLQENVGKQKNITYISRKTVAMLGAKDEE